MIRRWTALAVIAISLLGPDGERACADPAAKPPSQADVNAAARRLARGLTMMEKHDFAGAIGELEQAYQLDPQNVYLYNLGAAHQSNADRDQAIEYYRRYLAVEPAGRLADEARWQLAQLEAARDEQARRDEAARLERERADAQREQDRLRNELTVAQVMEKAMRAEATAAKERADRAERVVRSALPCQPGTSGCGVAADNGNGIADDASSGRGWVMPTALTAPAGTWTFSDFDLYVLSASYAVTDRLTVGVNAMVPTGAAFRFGSLTAKHQLLSSGRVQVAAQTKLTYLRNPESTMSDMVTIGDLGGAVTLCIDSVCHSHLSGYLGAGVTRAGRTSALLAGAGALVLKMGAHMKAVFELDKGGGGEVGNGDLGWFGLRFTWKTAGLDLGGVLPLDDAGRKWIGGGLPFIGLTVRSYGE